MKLETGTVFNGVEVLASGSSVYRDPTSVGHYKRLKFAITKVGDEVFKDFSKFLDDEHVRQFERKMARTVGIPEDGAMVFALVMDLYVVLQIENEFE